MKCVSDPTSGNSISACKLQSFVGSWPMLNSGLSQLIFPAQTIPIRHRDALAPICIYISALPHMQSKIYFIIFVITTSLE